MTVHLPVELRLASRGVAAVDAWHDPLGDGLFKPKAELSWGDDVIPIRPNSCCTVKSVFGRPRSSSRTHLISEAVRGVLAVNFGLR